MNFNLKGHVGFLLIILSAIGFGIVYESVTYSFMTDSFMLLYGIGNWSSPNNIVNSVVNIASIILIVRFIVSLMWRIQRQVNIEKRYEFLIAVVLFAVVQWWSVPIVHYIGFGGIHGEAQGLYSWSARWSQFGRPEFFGMAIASIFMMFMEYLRRYFVGRPLAGKMKFAYDEAHAS